MQSACCYYPRPNGTHVLSSGYPIQFYFMCNNTELQKLAVQVHDLSAEGLLLCNLHATLTHDPVGPCLIKYFILFYYMVMCHKVVQFALFQL